MKDFMRRSGWAALAILFILTGVVFSAIIIYQGAHQNNSNNQNQNQNQNKLKGTQMQNFTPVSKVTSLQVIDQKKGNGKVAKIGSTITVVYTGAVASTGKIFESSLDSQSLTATFKLGSGLIKGWQQGIPGMEANGQRRLLIPASLAYGPASPSPDIPPNSDLVFDITLLSVK